MTGQLPKNNSWKLTSTGMNIWEYIVKFSFLALFSPFLLERKIKRKKQTTFTTYPALEFDLAPQFTLNCESQKLVHDWNFQGNTRNKMNDREFQISLHLSFDNDSLRPVDRLASFQEVGGSNPRESKILLSIGI